MQDACVADQLDAAVDRRINHGLVGRTTSKRWHIGTRRVGREDLPDALHQYWESVSDQFPGVSGIRVVLIDLTVRDEKSGV